jgi:hypothetical protein
MIALLRPATCLAALLVLLSGCSNSVTTLLKSSKQTNAIAPGGPVVQNELKGRSFEVGTIGFDVRNAEDKQGTDIPDSACLELFGSQLRKAFDGAGLGNGAMPATSVNVAIERLRLEPAMFLLSRPSEFRVRMEIAGAGGRILMRGQFQSSLSAPSFKVMGGGAMVPVSLPAGGWEYVALANMFPAVAVVITATTQGLQQGKTLDEIKVYPKDSAAGATINPDLFLKNAPFGMTEMDYEEVGRVITAARGRGGP